MNTACCYLLITKGAQSHIIKISHLILSVYACEVVLQTNSTSNTFNPEDFSSTYSYMSSGLRAEQPQARGLGFYRGLFFLLWHTLEEGRRKTEVDVVKWGSSFREQDVVFSLLLICVCACAQFAPLHIKHAHAALIYIRSVLSYHLLLTFWSRGAEVSESRLSPTVPLMWQDITTNISPSEYTSIQVT